MPIMWEDFEQAAVIDWFRLRYKDVLIVASANGGLRNKRTAIRLKKLGVLAGMPDLNIVRAAHGYHGLFIEMKDPGAKGRRKGTVSTVQISRLNKLNAEGYYAVACWGFKEAKAVIDWYLSENDKGK